MIYSVLFTIILIAALAIYVAKKKEEPLCIELGKATLSVLSVFLGVFLAQLFSNYYNTQRDKVHMLKLLNATHQELENFNTYLQDIPDTFSQAKQQIKGYKPKDLFEDNPIELPFIVSTTLNDTNIIRTMHPQSITSILAAFANSKTMLSAFNREEFSEEQLQSSIDVAAFHITTLTKYVGYEIKYQSDAISEEGLFNLHRTLIIDNETKPISSLIKIK